MAYGHLNHAVGDILCLLVSVIHNKPTPRSHGTRGLSCADSRAYYSAYYVRADWLGHGLFEGSGSRVTAAGSQQAHGTKLIEVGGVVVVGSRSSQNIIRSCTRSVR